MSRQQKLNLSLINNSLIKMYVNLFVILGKKLKNLGLEVGYLKT